MELMLFILLKGFNVNHNIVFYLVTILSTTWATLALATSVLVITDETANNEPTLMAGPKPSMTEFRMLQKSESRVRTYY